MNASPTEQALRRHLRSHNGSALAAAGISLGLALAGWAVLYGMAWWVTMFGATIARGVDSQPPASFHWIFVVCATVLVIAAVVDAWLFPDERAVDSRPPAEHLLDIALFIPRLTMAFWGNLSAIVSLPNPDRALAAELLDRLKDGGKVPFQMLPTQIPNEKSRARIVEALAVTQLIDLRKAEGMTWLYLSSLAPSEFHRRAIGDERGAGDMPGMRSAHPRARRNLLTGPAPGAIDDPPDAG